MAFPGEELRLLIGVWFRCLHHLLPTLQVLLVFPVNQQAKQFPFHRLYRRQPYRQRQKRCHIQISRCFPDSSPSISSID